MTPVGNGGIGSAHIPPCIWPPTTSCGTTKILPLPYERFSSDPSQRPPGRMALSTRTSSAGERSKALVIQQTGGSIAASDVSVTS